MPDIEAIKKEYEELLKQLSDPELVSDWEKFEELTKKKGFLEKIIEKEKEIQEIKNKIEENKLVISAKEDPELISLAEAETFQLAEKQKILEKEVENLLIQIAQPSTSGPGVSESIHTNRGDSAVIVEIRAGTGGEEAALFAGGLFRMYSKYAQNQNWQVKTLDAHPTELGGFKEIIFELKGGEVFSRMRREAGVHRVQRIPQTEKSGRVHTSTVSVAVLPKPKKTQIKINPQDLKTDFYRASGPGGQYVNKRETAVRITHLPTGIVVTSQTERNQLQNKENALAILGARILERKEMMETEKMGEKRRSQIKRAKRAEKIRTYNFPQDRVTDHRVKKNWHNIEKIMDGELDPIVKSLEKEEL